MALSGSSVRLVWWQLEMSLGRCLSHGAGASEPPVGWGRVDLGARGPTGKGPGGPRGRPGDQLSLSCP